MPNEPAPRLTLCLAMDLKRSTATGLRLSTRRLDRFNLALVNQLRPHLQAVGLDQCLIKFTGDGWLVMTDEAEHAAPLCCLAIIMGSRFQPEMAREASLAQTDVPALRLAICWRRDLIVELPNGLHDFVGDSVRRAVRACQLCHDNETLIDDTVLRWVHHDFHARRLEFSGRLNEFPGIKMEEELALHTLAELKVESAEELDAPEYFVNTLAIIGRNLEAEQLADRISDHLQSAADSPAANRTELTTRFNRLLLSAVDFETALRILRDMRESEMRPDVSTFNALIAKSADYQTQCKWLQRMKQEGLKPDIRTFNTLIASSPDDNTARRWLSRMAREGLKPDTILLNTLIGRTRDHTSAQMWLELMERRGVVPDAGTYDMMIERSENLWQAKAYVEKMFESGLSPGLVTFLTLFSKDLTIISADELLAWYLKLPQHPPEPIHRAIAFYRRVGRLEDALRLCLDYPYTQAAIKVIRSNPGPALTFFSQIVENDPRHANGAYSLGIAYRELNQSDKSAFWLKRALALAAPGHRREEILRSLAALPSEESTTATLSY